jgi:hypothetical protein
MRPPGKPMVYGMVKRMPAISVPCDINRRDGVNKLSLVNRLPQQAASLAVGQMTTTPTLRGDNAVVTQAHISFH